MHNYLQEMLACPTCHGDLKWEIVQTDANRILKANTTCQSCGAEYPIRDGIGLFLPSDVPRDDLWAQVDSKLVSFFRQQPEIEQRLLNDPLESLNPADQFFRSMLLESKGDFETAKTVADEAFQKLYTPEMLACGERQMQFVVDAVVNSNDPIVDLASGRGYLVEKLIKSNIQNPIIMTDFSPQILRRNRQWYSQFGLYDPLSLIACDARYLPFKDASVAILTTYLGLANISEPGTILAEWKRILAGTLYAVSHLYAENDDANSGAIRKIGLETFLFEHSTISAFAEVGWTIDIPSRCRARAMPTPKSEFVDDLGIDGLPVAETEIEWCVVTAKN